MQAGASYQQHFAGNINTDCLLGFVTKQGQYARRTSTDIQEITNFVIGKNVKNRFDDRMVIGGSLRKGIVRKWSPGRADRADSRSS